MMYSTLIHSIYKTYTSNSKLVDSILKPLLEMDGKECFINIHSLQELYKGYLKDLGLAFIKSLGTTFHNTVEDGAIL